MSAADGQVQGPLFLLPLSPRRLGPSPSPPVIGRHLPGGRGCLDGGQDRAGQGRAAGRVAASCRGKVQAGVGFWEGPRPGGGLGRAGCPVRHRRRRQGLGSGRGRACVAGQGPGRAGVGARGRRRARIPAGAWCGVRAGQGRVWAPPRVWPGYGPQCDGLAPASAPGPRLAGPGREGAGSFGPGSGDPVARCVFGKLQLSR